MGGSAVDNQTVQLGSTATEPTAPTKAGYIFAGWYKEIACTNEYSFATPVTAKITLYAKWEKDTVTMYTINLDANGGTVESATLQFNDFADVVLPTPTYTGYTFQGWYEGTTLVEAVSEYREYNLVAKWVSNETLLYSVTLDANGGELTNSTIDFNGATDLSTLVLPTPTRDGYSFEGWYEGTTKVTSITEYKNYQLTAEWSSDSGILTVGADQTYTTISAALADAKEGNTIKVLAGTYTENVTINVANVKLVGPNANVNPNEEARNAEAILTGTVTITSDAENVEINGFAFTTTGKVVTKQSFGLVFANNYVYDTAAPAASWQEGTGYVSGAVAVGEDGISENLQFINNKFENVKDVNVNISKVFNISFDGNVFKNFGYDAIRFDDSSYEYGMMSFTNNEFVNDTPSGYNGIYFRSYGGPGSNDNTIVIKGNKFVNIGNATNATTANNGTGTLYVNAISARNNQEHGTVWTISDNYFESCYNYIRLRNNGTAANHTTYLWACTVENNQFIGLPTSYYFAVWNASDSDPTQNPETAVFGANYYEDNSGAVISDLSTYAAYFKQVATYGTALAEKPVEGNIEAAKFITVSYDVDGGNGIGSERVLVGTELELPTPTKEGCKFLGWSYTYGATDYIKVLPATQTEDLTLYANWEQLAGYTVNFDYAGGVSEEVYLKNATEVNHFVVNNYNYNEGAFWTGTNYKYYVYIGTSACDPKATFSDRVYIGKDSVTGFYVITDIVTAGSYSWPSGAEYVITVSNSYTADTVAEQVTKTLSVGNIVAFDGDITTACAATPVNVCFYATDTVPSSYTLTKYVTTAESLPTPSRLGFEFDGWYAANNTKIESVYDLTEGISITAKWIELTPVTDITINTLPEDLEDNATFQIVASVVPTDAFFQQIIYSSSNTDVLTVSSTGLITAVNPGTADITVRDYMSKKVLTYTIRVYSMPSIDVEFEEGYTGTLAVDETVQLNATTYGKDINQNDVVYTYTSSDENVATVDQNGLVTAVALGAATITISDNVSSEYEVQVGIVVNNLAVETKLEQVIALLAKANFAVVEYGNISLYDDNTVIYYDSIYGSVNKYLFDDFAINTDYVAQAEATTSGHKDRRSVDTIEFVTVHDTATLTGTVESIARNMSSSSTSIHYTVGNDMIYQVVPEKYIAYHAGDGTSVSFAWQPTGVMAPADNSAPVVTIEQVDSTWYYVINGTRSNLVAPITGSKNGTAMTIENPGNHSLTNLGPAWEIIDGEYCFAPSWVCFSQVAAGKISSLGGNNNSIGIEMCVNTSSDVYDTWQRTAQLVSDILIRNNLGLHRVKQHNTWSGKNCPQSMIAADYWSTFMEMVELNYILSTEYAGVEISMVSNNPDILDNTGRIYNAPQKTTTVSYTITVTLDGSSKEITLYSVVPGETTWTQWDGNRPADQIWNGDCKFGRNKVTA